MYHPYFLDDRKLLIIMGVADGALPRSPTTHFGNTVPRACTTIPTLSMGTNIIHIRHWHQRWKLMESQSFFYEQNLFILNLLLELWESLIPMDTGVMESNQTNTKASSCAVLSIFIGEIILVKLWEIYYLVVLIEVIIYVPIATSFKQTDPKTIISNNFNFNLFFCHTRTCLKKIIKNDIRMW